MKIKAAIKYQSNECLKTMRNFYIVIILVIAFFVFTVEISGGSSVMSMGGAEMSTMIFLFVVGLNSFKETFLMMLQNGVSRLTLFFSTTLNILFISILMAVADRFVLNIGGLYSDFRENVIVSGMFDMLYEKRVASMHVVALNLEAILIMSGLYIAAFSGGYFITTAYYRMNKLVKVVVSVGLPASIFVLLPMLDKILFGGKITVKILDMLYFIIGGKAENPYNTLFSCIFFSIVCLGLTWLLIRRAIEKSD